MTTENQLLSNIESNPVYYTILKIKLLTLLGGTNYDYDALAPAELVSISESNLRDVGRILTSDSLRRVAWHFLDYGAATSLILQFRADIPEATSFRHIKTLQKMGVVIPAVKSKHSVDSKGGPRPTIWMTPDATLDQMNESQKLHRKLLSPKYVAGEKLGQLVLEEYIEPRNVKEITGQEVWTVARKHRIRGELSDIVTFAMNYLSEQGIKVWR